MSPSDKSIHGPPVTQNNRSVASAAVVQSSFDAGQCAHSVTTPQHGAEANSQRLTVGEYGKLDEASLKIVEKALVEQVAPIGRMPRLGRQRCARLGPSGSRVTT